jgi:hypothetical protein
MSSSGCAERLAPAFKPGCQSLDPNSRPYRERLGRAGKFDCHTSREIALEWHPGFTEQSDVVGFAVKANDCIGIDVLGLANEFLQNELAPVFLLWRAIGTKRGWRADSEAFASQPTLDF